MKSGEVGRRCGRAVGCHVKYGRKGEQPRRDELGGYTLVTGEAWGECRNGGGSTTDHRKRVIHEKKKREIKHISTTRTLPRYHWHMTDLPSLLPSSLKVKASKRRKRGGLSDISYDIGGEEGAKDILGDTIVQKLVAPQVPLQSANVDRVRVLEAIQLCQLDVESHFVALVLGRVTVDRFGGKLDRRSCDVGRGGFGFGRDL